MAIFVALIFQVLFLFFAMAINVGLVVHDKVNLQNAVDLAAYYAAQRQAEQLNVIAHSNYQIRQAWKLLNWRYYVLGTMGRQGDIISPAQPSYPGGRADAPDVGIMNPGNPNIIPVMCTTYQPTWISVPPQETVCKDKSKPLPNLKDVPVVAGFLPFNLLFSNLVKQVKQEISKSCDIYSGYNWILGAIAYTNYMLDQANRKEVIRGIAANLARKPQDMVDLNGDSIYVGARKTFEKNLTRTNFESVQEFKMLNPMEGLDSRKWLNELDIYYSLIYQDGEGSGDKCNFSEREISDLPKSKNANDRIRELFGPSNVETLYQYVNQGSVLPAGDPRKVSLGVEKNPWYLVYVGVKAKSQPRQVFSPFSAPIQFEAKAYATPFGGRIGPWWGNYWARGGETSGGNTTQIGPQLLSGGGFQNSNLKINLIPRYSRFPGDQLGLGSRLAQAQFVNQLGFAKASHFEYMATISELGPNLSNDMLPFSAGQTRIREMEIAAVIPDLFDITYYSIEPNWGEVYLPRLRANMQELGLTTPGSYPRGDLGARDPNSSAFSVKDQIALAQAAYQEKVNLLQTDVFWWARSREHLLTSWVHNDSYGNYFNFPSGRFGNCAEFDDSFQDFKVPGTCVNSGGRTGYSVKIVSGDYLRASLPLGGSGQGDGKILNPPPDNW